MGRGRIGGFRSKAREGEEEEEEEKRAVQQRTGLRKNTNYTLRLSVANPGGAGPLGPESDVFATYATFPDIMQPVRVAAISSTELLASWTPLTGWDVRGGLSVFAYYIKISGVDYNFSKTYSIFPSNASDPAEAELVVPDLQPNSVSVCGGRGRD
eukprot:767148-Hanusia_phi.AAC.1